MTRNAGSDHSNLGVVAIGVNGLLIHVGNVGATAPRYLNEKKDQINNEENL